jgi:hypothetical protein
VVIGFIEHLQFITTSNYNAIANSHTLIFTTACTKSSQSAVFTYILCFCSHVPKFLLLCLPSPESTELITRLAAFYSSLNYLKETYTQLFLVTQTLHRPLRERSFSVIFYCCLVDCYENTIPKLLFAGRCLAMVVVSFLISLSLRSNKRKSYYIVT